VPSVIGPEDLALLIHCKQGLAYSGIYQQTAYQTLCAGKLGGSPPVPAVGAVQDRCLSAGKDQTVALLGRGQAAYNSQRR
jgi:hypothetical protein